MDYEKLIYLRGQIANRIVELLNSNEFELSIDYLKYIHKFLFKDIFTENGNFRTYNISKKEPILRGDTVIYPDYHTLLTYLNYDIDNEKSIDYTKFTAEKKIKKIASFTSRIWQAHPFEDGNTRTTSVFIQKYLKTIGYETDNEMFKNNSGYFRDALVRACYYNQELHIRNNLEALILFYNKILIDTNIDLDDDLLYIKELYTSQNNIKVRKRDI